MRSLGMAKWQEIETKQMIRLLQKVEDNHNDQEAKRDQPHNPRNNKNSPVETSVDGATIGRSNLDLTKTMLVPHHLSKDN